MVIPDIQACFRQVVEYITNASPIDEHSYFVKSTVSRSSGYPFPYFLTAEFTVCNVTAHQMLVKLNSAIASSVYSAVLSSFCRGRYTVSGTFSLDEPVTTDAPTFRPVEPEGIRIKPIHLSLGNNHYRASPYYVHQFNLIFVLAIWCGCCIALRSTALDSAALRTLMLCSV